MISLPNRDITAQRKLNPFLKNLDDDVLYHINLSKKTHDFKKMFGDVKVSQ